jgi:hypothetical protein
LGAVPLTPGAAIVTYSEDLHEQMDWIAEEISDWGGDAWVLPVGTLPATDEARIRRRATGRTGAQQGAALLTKQRLGRQRS